MILYLVRNPQNEIFSGHYGNTAMCHESIFLIRDELAGQRLTDYFDLHFQTEGSPQEIELFIRKGGKN